MSVAKVDALINLVGEIVSAENILSAALERIGSGDAGLLDSAEKLARHTRDLRHMVMSIRMVPISFILSRFPRVVRETAQKVGKLAELHVQGEHTELDKRIIERIVDPLTHLIRNAVDHGIEAPEERLAAGKPEQGRIELRAAHISGNIVIEVIDDGAGLSRDRILKKARNLGWTIADDADDADVWDLIFAPGFSTASSVTEISGRGVGMDVVRRNVNELGGSITIHSTPGHGTRITIHLPLTLAILDGLTVNVGAANYVLPIANVVASFQPRPGDIRTMGAEGELVSFAGAWVSVLRLHARFGIRDAIERPERGILVVVEAGGKRCALLVDALGAHQQVVIKSLETNFRRTEGIAGAAIVDDGHIALVLDIVALIRAVTNKIPVGSGV